MLLATVAVGNAQFFIEGSANFLFRDREVVEVPFTYLPQLEISFSPKVGYRLNDRIAVGANVSYSIYKVKYDNNSSFFTGVSEYMGSEWGFSVFSRYKIPLPKRFSLLFESSSGVRREIQKEKKDGTTRKTGTRSFVDVILFPVISYDLSDRFSIVTSFRESLNFDLQFLTIKGEDSGLKLHFNRVGFNARSEIFSFLSYINLGFIYNF